MSPLHEYLSSLPQAHADALRMITIAGFFHSITVDPQVRALVHEQFSKRLLRALAIEAFGSREEFKRQSERFAAIAGSDFETIRAMALEFLTGSTPPLHYRRPEEAQR